MKILITGFLFLTIFHVFGQNIPPPNFTAVDSLYREDQFYCNITYNALQKKPSSVLQNKFTPSFSFGVLRDMPINKNRTLAIAAGIGYTINNYNQNILISETNGIPEYNLIATNVNFTTNKLTFHYIDIPIEFRWRNATPFSHKFWRIYTGFKFSYLVYDRSKYEDANTLIIVSKNPDANKLQYGTYLNIGYNTINFYAYYGFNSIFKTAQLDSNSIQMNTMNFGFMFYIL